MGYNSQARDYNFSADKLFWGLLRLLIENRNDIY
jgi:hypothetical protein